MASLGGVGGADNSGWHPPGGWHPKEKKFYGQIYKEQWRNEVGQVKKVWGDTHGGGDTRVKAIKSDSDSESDEQKKSCQVFREKMKGWHPQLPARVSPTLVTPLATL